MRRWCVRKDHEALSQDHCSTYSCERSEKPIIYLHYRFCVAHVPTFKTKDRKFWMKYEGSPIFAVTPLLKSALQPLIQSLYNYRLRNQKTVMIWFPDMNLASVSHHLAKSNVMVTFATHSCNRNYTQPFLKYHTSKIKSSPLLIYQIQQTEISEEKMRRCRL